MSDENIFKDVPKLDFNEPAAEVDREAFKKVVESRRSVRVYEDKPIPEKDVQECIDLALLAPNSSNLQPWEFHWVRDPGKRKQLNIACFNQPAARTAAEIIVVVARTNTWNKHRMQMLDLLNEQGSRAPKSALQYYTKLVPLVYSQGLFSIFGWMKWFAFSIIGTWKIVPREPNSHAEMRTWAAKSAALACQNLMLAFRAYGYDSCPMEGLDSARVRKLLKLPGDARVVMAISAGYRADTGVYGPRLRFPREQFVFEH